MTNLKQRYQSLKMLNKIITILEGRNHKLKGRFQMLFINRTLSSLDTFSKYHKEDRDFKLAFAKYKSDVVYLQTLNKLGYYKPWDEESATKKSELYGQSYKLVGDYLYPNGKLPVINLNKLLNGTLDKSEFKGLDSCELSVDIWISLFVIEELRKDKDVINNDIKYIIMNTILQLAIMEVLFNFNDHAFVEVVLKEINQSTVNYEELSKVIVRWAKTFGLFFAEGEHLPWLNEFYTDKLNIQLNVKEQISIDDIITEKV